MSSANVFVHVVSRSLLALSFLSVHLQYFSQGYLVNLSTIYLFIIFLPLTLLLRFIFTISKKYYYYFFYYSLNNDNSFPFNFDYTVKNIARVFTHLKDQRKKLFIKILLNFHSSRIKNFFSIFKCINCIKYKTNK